MMGNTATINAAWREQMIERVYRAMNDQYEEAWNIGCWCHGTGHEFARIAVDAMLAASDQ